MPSPSVRFRRWSVAAWVALAAPLAAQDAGVVRFVPLDGPLISECDGPPVAGALACRVRRQFSEAELAARLRTAPIRVDGDTLTVVVVRPARKVMLCCGIQAPMSPAGNDRWVLSVRVPDVRKARLSLQYLVNDSAIVGEKVFWRGPDAPPAAPRSAVLRGALRTDTIASAAMAMPRVVTTYLPAWGAATARPVVFLADGGSVGLFAPIIDAMVAAGSLPPVALVGAHPGPRVGGPGPEADPRNLEYIDVGGERFRRHERFFADELTAWAIPRFGLDTAASRHAVWGASNSGYYALWMGLTHPDRFGHALGFSPAGRMPALPEGGTMPRSVRFDIVSGTLEPTFTRLARAWDTFLRDGGSTVTRREYVGGHDDAVWAEEFAEALRRMLVPERR